MISFAGPFFFGQGNLTLRLAARLGKTPLNLSLIRLLPTLPLPIDRLGLAVRGTLPFWDFRSEATSRRAERTAMPAVRSSRPAQAVPPSPPKRSSTSRPDLQRVVGDVRNAVASTTVDLAKRPRKAEPLVPRPVRSDTHTSLTGADLAIWRSRLDLTQQAAADRLGVRQGTISKAESKGRVKLGPTLLLALAAALAKEHRTA